MKNPSLVAAVFVIAFSLCGLAQADQPACVPQVAGAVQQALGFDIEAGTAISVVNNSYVVQVISDQGDAVFRKILSIPVNETNCRVAPQPSWTTLN